MAHAFEKEIQALLRGERLQFDHQNDPDGWENFDPLVHDNAAAHLLAGVKSSYRWQIKPRTVKIGGREVEAPVREPEEGQQVHFLNTWSAREEVKVDSIRFNPKGNPRAVEMLRAKGLLFATEEACQAAHDAIHALLRGEA